MCGRYGRWSRIDEINDQFGIASAAFLPPRYSISPGQTEAIGQTLKSKLSRSSDYCFRLGGEEFGIIFSDLAPDEGLRYVDAIRLAIENLGFEHQWNSAAKVITISMGLLSITPGPGTTIDSIYKKADQALYKAKEKGRNQIVADELNTSV